MRRGGSAVDVEGLLLRNSEARLAYFRATEEGQKARGFLMGVMVLAVYCTAFVVSILCSCNDPAECGCSRSNNALLEHSALLTSPTCGCTR